MRSIHDDDVVSGAALDELIVGKSIACRSKLNDQGLFLLVTSFDVTFSLKKNDALSLADLKSIDRVALAQAVNEEDRS